jgi:threonine dehydratase
MPASAPLAKVNAAQGYSARVVLHGMSLKEATEEAMAIAEREGRRYVPPFDDDAVIAGQGTLGLEILDQWPDVREVLVPTGGGGLLAGVALAVKETAPHVRVVGVQAAAMEGIVASRAAGTPTEAPAARTIADGVAVAGPSDRTFALIQRYVDDVIAVPEDAIIHAIVLLLERAKMVVEGAGALGVAALLGGFYRPSGPTVAILSGGNIDINLAGSIIRKGLADAGRYQRVVVEVSDMPGELALVTTAIARAEGNVLESEHRREAPGLPVGVAVVDFLLEVNGAEHFERVWASLLAEGITPAPGEAGRLMTPNARRRHHGWS